MAGQARGDDWQLVLIAWGEKYGSADVNALVREVHAQGRGPARTVLITDRPRPGLDAGIETRPHPQAFLLPWMKRSGCQAKLGMFAEGVLPTDLPAIFLDLDTLILGDVAQLLGAVADDAQIAILQSAILPFGAVARRLYRLTGGRRYARGNSSVVVFHPARCGFIAARFLDLVAQHPNGGFRPLIADERFISWVAQPRMRAVPRRLAVKLPTETMFPRLWFGRLYGALPWVRARRGRLVAVTLPGDAVKAEVLRDLPEGAIVTDRKGRRMEWSDRYLGPLRARLIKALAATDPAAKG
ncbi:MAG: hypothetical protein IAE87_06305 [Rhodobacteraceae bacterium]|jgi:hypothetical protein|nr:hypothetical protein [Paracoccaceae bacterium]